MNDSLPSITEAAAANVIVNDSGVLFVREGKPSVLGRWSLPAVTTVGPSLRPIGG